MDLLNQSQGSLGVLRPYSSQNHWDEAGWRRGWVVEVVVLSLVDVMAGLTEFCLLSCSPPSLCGRGAGHLPVSLDSLATFPPAQTLRTDPLGTVSRSSLPSALWRGSTNEKFWLETVVGRSGRLGHLFLPRLPCIVPTGAGTGATSVISFPFSLSISVTVSLLFSSLGSPHCCYPWGHVTTVGFSISCSLKKVILPLITIYFL